MRDRGKAACGAEHGRRPLARHFRGLAAALPPRALLASLRPRRRRCRACADRRCRRLAVEGRTSAARARTRPDEARRRRRIRAAPLAPPLPAEDDAPGIARTTPGPLPAAIASPVLGPQTRGGAAPPRRRCGRGPLRRARRARRRLPAQAVDRGRFRLRFQSRPAARQGRGRELRRADAAARLHLGLVASRAQGIDRRRLHALFRHRGRQPPEPRCRRRRSPRRHPRHQRSRARCGSSSTPSASAPTACRRPPPSAR